jgi:hypothetical protein
MEETANAVLTKLNLVDPTLSPFSAYQQSAEVKNSKLRVDLFTHFLSF